MLTSPLIMKFVKGLVQCAVEQYRGEFLTRCHSKAVYVCVKGGWGDTGIYYQLPTIPTYYRGI